LKAILLLQAYLSAVFRICGASRGTSASAELLVINVTFGFCQCTSTVICVEMNDFDPERKCDQVIDDDGD